jgi:Flp pilus assembly protein TadG
MTGSAGRFSPPRAVVNDQGRQRGQSMVEFALTLPLLLLMLMGMLDLGRGLYAYSVVANAAREGARAGIVASTSDSAIRTAVRQLTVGLEAIPDNKIAITPAGSRTTGGTVKVTVTYNFRAATPLIDTFFPGGVLPLVSSATMRVE